MPCGNKIDTRNTEFASNFLPAATTYTQKTFVRSSMRKFAGKFLACGNDFQLIDFKRFIFCLPNAQYGETQVITGDFAWEAALTHKVVHRFCGYWKKRLLNRSLA